MPKRPFKRKIKRRRHGAAFWDHEYTEGGHLKLSESESEDLAKFTRWLSRQKDITPIRAGDLAVDFGCGNGRNLVYLAQNFDLKGMGYDISEAAIAEARRLSRGLSIKYEARSMAGDFDLPDNSADIALDMMASHFLSEKERAHLRDEIYRILRPGGWLFMKTFLRDGDLHTRRLLAESPAKEDGSYIHPVIGVPEHAYGEEELVEFISERFKIHKVYRSHKHVSRGKARKRRTISIYAEKDPYQ